jgi:CubicO group peptidase (beta-lactamase class C family)
VGNALTMTLGVEWNERGVSYATLVGKLIEKGTGQALPTFADTVLFEPLGIEAGEWRRAKAERPTLHRG